MVRRVMLLGVCGVLLARAVASQTTTTSFPTSVDILVLPATGDPAVIAPIATRTTVIGTFNVSTGTVTPNSQCGRTATTPQTAPLVNPTQVEFDDPFTAGKKCSAFIPTGLPDGTGYRAVAVAIFAGTCQSQTGQDLNPCASARSLVGVPPFGVASFKTPPVVLTNLGVRP